MDRIITLVRRSGLKLIAAVVIASPNIATAAYPDKPISVALPFALGGPVDILMRAVQEPLQKELGQPVVIVPKEGASGIVATRYVARAPADGYTLLIQTNGMLITPQINKQAGFDPLRDFEPVALLGVQPMVLVTHPSLPVKTVQELISYAKAHPGEIDFASSGPASNGRLATETFMKLADIKMNHVPYKGVGQITLALMSGEVQLMLSSVTPQISQQIKEGKLNLLGTASAGESALMPGVEPISNTLKGFQAEVWFLIAAPAGTPPDVVDKLQKSITHVLNTPQMQERFKAASATVKTATPDVLKHMMADEYSRIGEIVSEIGDINK
ncbi:Bug family tripartite tricarboxylate transporter substrate binding protein [Advenella mimigardefordensis]|uniref:Putative Bug-like extracytoplasmic solute binding receptor, TTT family n=1 Tax=Advenella mimigardefordensis (strain DSM 17166 / LMG 22922 / DPN7) TaxID=1247726 RepID=W0PB69_ADVMD|nr:tripartite tricarboxylate transporter substrate-binding protein [Advenella mimigardefordensis]AHG64114.1 putative Bug-like extracytoplasmic solute binding receptor, TTT family [Advenella mimigardefordensis DPN7]